MGQKIKKIAVLCDYELLPERVGGMDCFFWMFDQKCKANGIQVDWFFPNHATHGGYSELTILGSNYQNVEQFFLHYFREHQPIYSYIYLHFIELCTPITKSIKKNTKATLIAVDHNPRPIGGYGLKKKVQKAIKGTLYAPYTDLFVGVSQYSKDRMIAEFGPALKKKTTVIFNGLEIDKFKKKTQFEFRGKFIVAAHLRKQKGIQDLILAVKALIKTGNYEFIIDLYGSGIYREELEQMVADNKLERYFNFKGSVSNLHAIYADYDYLIHPSHGETFCYSVVESLLSNLPVITTQSHGNVLGLVVENENGFLFKREDITALKDILFKIITKEMAITGDKLHNERLSRFSLEAMVDNYYNLLT